MEEKTVKYYQIKKADREIDWSAVERLEIGCKYLDTPPEICAFAQICYNDDGIQVHLWSENDDVRAVETGPLGAPYLDSCLEFFANFKPEIEHSGYINCECNANGALHCFYGEGRGDRRPVIDMGAEHPTPVPFKTETVWGYDLLIPLKLIETVYGNADYKTGSIIRANFYKCGDDTGTPHYGAFAKIDWPHPDFHRPEFFADMVIGE